MLWLVKKVAKLQKTQKKGKKGITNDSFLPLSKDKKN